MGLFHIHKKFSSIVALLAIGILFQNCASDFDDTQYQDTSSESPILIPDTPQTSTMPTTQPPTTPPTLPPTTTSSVTTHTIQGNGLVLNHNETLETSGLRLVQQKDGNLVIYKKDLAGTVLWASGVYSTTLCQSSTDNKVKCLTQFQVDGNLVSYAIRPNTAYYVSKYKHCLPEHSHCSIPYWSSQTLGSGYSFVLQETAPYWKIIDATGAIKASSNDSSKFYINPEINNFASIEYFNANPVSFSF